MYILKKMHWRCTAFKKCIEDTPTQKDVFRMYILKKMHWRCTALKKKYWGYTYSKRCIQDVHPQKDVLYSRCTASKRCIKDVHPQKDVLKMDILKKMYWGCTSSKRYIKSVEFNFYQTCICTHGRRVLPHLIRISVVLCDVFPGLQSPRPFVCRYV